MKSRMEGPSKTDIRATTWHCDPTPGPITGKKHGVKGYMRSTFIVALFTIAKTWKEHKCHWPGMESIWYICIMEYYSAMKEDEIMLFAETWMDLHIAISSVQFSHSVVSNSLGPHGLHHSRPPCPSPTPGVYSDSCPLSQWCHPTMWSSAIPFSLHLQSFPASGSFPMSQLFTSGGQSIGVSASASVLPMNTHDWSPLG